MNSLTQNTNERINKKRVIYITTIFILILIMFSSSFILMRPGDNSVKALSQGPNYASATGDCINDTGTGTVAWTSPGNAFSDNTTNASVSVDGTTSNYIKCTNFSFSIPSIDTIDGIVVGVERTSNSTSNGGSSDAAMRIVKGGTIGSTDRSTATTYPANTMTYEDHGGSTDKWGETWTASDINASNFGAAFATVKGSSGGAAHSVTVDTIRITVYYTTNVAPGTPSVSSPSNGATVVDTTPDIQFSSTDTNSDYIRYRVQIYNGTTNNGTNCTGTSYETATQTSSQTGFSGQNTQTSTAYTSGSTATYTVQATMTRGNSYCYQVDAIDPGGTNSYGSLSTYRTFTINSIPSAPTLITPTSGATGVDILPTFTLRTTDADSDYLRYKITLYGNDCTSAPAPFGSVQTFDQTSSQTNWTGQDTQTNTAYVGNPVLSSSTIATYTMSGTSLNMGTTYCWKASAIDPGGTNTFSTDSSTQTFTTTSSSDQVIIQGGVDITGGTEIQ